MTTKKCVLIADDIKEYLYEEIPDDLRLICGADLEIITAADLQETLQKAVVHGRNSEQPLDLIVLDMHMPLHKGAKTIEPKAGIDALMVIQLLAKGEVASIDCPIVIYTAYASLQNCFLAAKAGARAYISKFQQEYDDRPTEGGREEFVSVCKELLSSIDKNTVSAYSQWLDINSRWLDVTFLGKWVALVQKNAAEKAGLADPSKHPERDGIVILSGATRKEVVDLVLSMPELLREFPEIFMVTKTEGLKATKMEEKK
jgi:CheY-like chemotaxis protein